MTGPQQAAQEHTGHRETASGIGAPNVEPAGVTVDASREGARQLAYTAVTAAIRKAIAASTPTEEEISLRLGRRKDYVASVLANPAGLTLAKLGAILWACGQEVDDVVVVPLDACSFCDTPRADLPYLVTRTETNCRICKGCATLALEMLAEAEATSGSLPHDSTVGAATPTTDAAADVPHETPDIQP